MKNIFLLLVAVTLMQSSFSQIWFTKTASISFFSQTEVEDIKAENDEGVSFIDVAKNEFRFQVLIKSFRFPKAAMQEHFNGTYYMNSDLYPKAAFTGQLANAASVNFKKDGSYKVIVNGTLTMHGITNPISVPGTITIKNGQPSVKASFMVPRKEYGIQVPRFTAAKIAESIQVTVAAHYQPYQQ